MKIERFTLKDLILQALVAGIYVALTLVFSSISYGDIQFRIAEVLIILVLFNPKFAIGILVGTLLANINSTLGPIDWICGTLASAISIVLMLKLYKKSVALALLAPAAVNGVIVAWMLYVVLQLPILYSIATVFFGEFVVVFIGGGLLYQSLSNNQGFRKLVE